MFINYKSCVGRKYYRPKLKKLKKPISCKKKSIICNNVLNEKKKIIFLTQLFRWFRKDSKYYKIKCNLKKNLVISDLDIINLSVKIQKAGFKNLLKKLNYCLIDYKTLKRRSYSLYFQFFFIDIKNIEDKQITVDIIGKKFDKYHIFLTVNGYYLKEFYNIINVLNKRDNEKKPPDFNDDILDNIEYIYQWNKYKEVLLCEIYMPWFYKRDDYYVYMAKRFKKERKYNIIIKERKFSGIFPLKNVRGYIVVMEKEKADSTDYVFFEEKFRLNYFRKQRDFFFELKELVNIINLKHNINSIIVYFHIEYLKN